MIPAAPAVELRGVGKRFGEVVANRGIDLAVATGEVHALLGENGAGKSTLMRILYGLTSRDEGDILVAGRAVEIASPGDAIAAGIGMVTQHFSLVGPMTVAENLALGRARGWMVDLEEAARAGAVASERFGIRLDPSARVDDLSVGERQRVEILKALVRNCRVLILDEPTAVLVPHEIETLFAGIRGLQSEGMAVVFISHKLNEVMAISDRITVLRHGSVVGTVPRAGTDQRQLAAMMVGRPTFGVAGAEHGVPPGPVRLRVEGLRAEAEDGTLVLRDVSLEVRGGEILGVAGVSGNGQTELAEVLSGVRKPAAGSVMVDGQELAGARPSAVMAAGVGRIPEDRHGAAIGELDVATNLALEHLDGFRRGPALDEGRLYAHAVELIERFGIKAGPRDRVRTLSGGNMQKVLLARVLSRQPAVLIVAQPTRGLDVGATEYVQRRLLDQRQAGAAVLLISEDLEEVLLLADRVVVMYEGAVVGEVDRRDADPDRLGLLMAGMV